MPLTPMIEHYSFHWHQWVGTLSPSTDHRYYAIYLLPMITKPGTLLIPIESGAFSTPTGHNLDPLMSEAQFILWTARELHRNRSTFLFNSRAVQCDAIWAPKMCMQQFSNCTVTGSHGCFVPCNMVLANALCLGCGWDCTDTHCGLQGQGDLNAMWEMCTDHNVSWIALVWT